MLLIDYLIASLGKLNTTLGYSASGSAVGDFSIVLEDSIISYDPTFTDESQCTDTLKLRKIGLYNMYKKVLNDVSDSVNFSADGTSFSNSQLFDHIQDKYNSAFSDAMPYLTNYQVGVYNYDISASCVHDEFYHHWH